MPTIRGYVLGLALMLAPVAMSTPALADALSYAQLSTMVTNMGYVPKEISTDPAKPKFEIPTTAGGYDIPLGLEISESKRFVWVTANLGVKTLTADQANNLLKRGLSVQPTQFWYTSAGNLMIGMAIDNREVTPAYLRYVIEKVGADTAATADIWGS